MREGWLCISEFRAIGAGVWSAEERLAHVPLWKDMGSGYGSVQVWLSQVMSRSGYGSVVIWIDWCIVKAKSRELRR